MKKERDKIKLREIRMEKKMAIRQEKAAGKALGRRGRFKLWGKRILVTLCGTALLGCVIELSYPAIQQWVWDTSEEAAGSYYNQLLEKEVTQEEILKVAAPDEEGSAAIDKMKQYSPEDTWAIYMYVCGSDLESGGENYLSDTTKYLIDQEVQAEVKERSLSAQNSVLQFVSDINRQGMDLPNLLYQPQAPVNWMEDDGLSGSGGAASSDIKEILSVDLPENIKIILQTGGASRWENERINPNRSQRFVYDSKGLLELENNFVQNMADPDTLSDFLTFCRDNYPADRTMVIFWNHGAGAFGYGVDDLYGDDSLSLKEMRQSFEQVYQSDENNPPFELIGFDACLMASLEVAENFHGFGRYLAASEELEPGEGWDYAEWLRRLSERPEMNGAQAGKAITDSYVEYYAKQTVQLKPLDIESVITFSVVDLNKAHTLYQAYEDLAAAALRDTANNSGMPALLGQATNRSVRYAESDYKTFNTVDLGLFMEEVSGLYPKEADKVMKALDEAVLYKRATSYASDSKGISVYYPTNIETLSGLMYSLDYINNISDSQDIKALYYYKIAGSLNEELQACADSMGYGKIKNLDVTPLKELENTQVEVSENGNFSLPVDDKTVALMQEAVLCLAKLDEKKNEVTYMGEDSFLYTDQDGQLRAEAKGEWISIDGNFLAVEILDSTDSAIKYRSRIRYNGADAYLILGYNLDTEKIHILGIKTIDVDSSGEDHADTVGRKTESMMPGDKIQPIYDISQLDVSQVNRKYGTAFTYKASSKIENRILNDGKYVQFIKVKDARGDKYYTPAIQFQVKKGTIINSGIMEDMSGIMK